MNTVDYLFPSKVSGYKHMSYQRAYQIVTELCNTVGFNGWCHRFRSERASQLCKEYGYRLETVLEFFGWESIATALEYVHSSIEDMKKLTPQIEYPIESTTNCH